MKYVLAHYFVIRIIYIENGFNIDRTACYLRNNFGCKKLMLLRFMGKFLKDFDLKEEIYNCLDKAIIDYQYVDFVRIRS